MEKLLKEYDEEFVSTKLFQGIQSKDCLVVLAGIKTGEDVNKKCQKTGQSYLHVILSFGSFGVQRKCVPMIYQLSNADIDLDSVDKNGLSPLHMSINNSLLEPMVALVKCGASCDKEVDMELLARLRGPSNFELTSVYQKFSPGYWDAVENDKAFKTNVLVKSWCRINISKNNKSVIEYAKEKGACEKIIKMLLQNEASIELAHATIAGDEERMRYLLMHHEVNLATSDLSNRESYFDHYSPLTLYGAALKYSHKHILHLLKNPQKVISDKKTNVEHIDKFDGSIACVIV
jgi:hypothetical protein